MDISEVEENLLAASDAKLHGEMCTILSRIYCKIMSIFPSLEAARPTSKSGIQALCSLHVALEKAKNVLQHCTECSKLYLAITGDSVLLKFEKAKYALVDGLRRVEDIVPQSIGCQIQYIVNELEDTVFLFEPSEKQIGDEIIALLQQGRKFDHSDNNELESFHQAATKLGITSSRAALAERRALKKLIEKALAEEDKRKESIVAFLLHLMRKYSKLFRSEFSDDNDSQGSAPCSPTVQGSVDDVGPLSNNHAFEQHLSKFSSFNFEPNNRRSRQMPLLPEELRCPISLQLIHDPVIIASGQTYERICIEKWFSDGHNTCPKTHQKLLHLSLIPNYSVKGLVASWCEQNGVPGPDGPPESLDLNYWRLALSESKSKNLKATNRASSCKLKEVKVVTLVESGTIEEAYEENTFPSEEEPELNVLDNYDKYLTILNEGKHFKKKLKVVDKLRRLLKDDDEARIYMGANGFVEALLRFVESAIDEGSAAAQESGAMALFNLGVNSNRNKEMMLAAGIIALLEEMISHTNCHGFATALYLSLSCLEEAKPVIGSSKAVPFLTQLLKADTDTQCNLDALHALYNISIFPPNIPYLLSAGIIGCLQSLLSSTANTWTEECVAVLINLASSQLGRDEVILSPIIVRALATILDTGELVEQEQAVSCLLLLCNGNDKCSQLVLQEGVIPALVSMSVNGTSRGKDKAHKLLMLFREQRQRDQVSAYRGQAPAVVHPRPESSNMTESMPTLKSKARCKSISRKKVGKALRFLRKSKSHSVYRC